MCPYSFIFTQFILSNYLLFFLSVFLLFSVSSQVSRVPSCVVEEVWSVSVKDGFAIKLGKIEQHATVHPDISQLIQKTN